MVLVSRVTHDVIVCVAVNVRVIATVGARDTAKAFVPCSSLEVRVGVSNCGWG